LPGFLIEMFKHPTSLRPSPQNNKLIPDVLNIAYYYYFQDPRVMSSSVKANRLMTLIEKPN
jgi:hypothetical protein